MKLKKFLSTICIISLGLCMAGCGEAKPDFEIIKTVKITHKTTYAGFNNEKLGMTVGYAGEIHYTTDIGESWPKSENNSFCRFGLEIVNDEIAYHCGNAGHVRKSSDGGKTWKEVSDYGDYEPDQCRYLSFFDDKNGWIAAPNKLGVTNDGGSTWSDIKLPDNIGNISCIELLNEKTGYLIDENKNMYITKDDGKTWENKKINIEDIDASINASPMIAMKFLDENIGYIYYRTSGKMLAGISTKDGGKTWEQELLPEVKVGSLYMSNDAKYITVTSTFGDELTLLKRK